MCVSAYTTLHMNASKWQDMCWDVKCFRLFLGNDMIMWPTGLHSCHTVDLHAYVGFLSDCTVCLNDYHCLYSMNTFKIDGCTTRTHASEYLARKNSLTFANMYTQICIPKGIPSILDISKSLEKINISWIMSFKVYCQPWCFACFYKVMMSP